MQRRGKEPTEHHPEVILNNFTTRLGHSIGRMFAALFPQNPQFLGRQVATFHNQRDFIFFRFHRWVSTNLILTPHTGVMVEPFQSRSAYSILLINSFLWWGGSFPGTFSKMRKKLESRSWDLVSHSSCAHFRKAPLTQNMESTSGSWRWVEGHLFDFIESEHLHFIQRIIHCRVHSVIRFSF